MLKPARYLFAAYRPPTGGFSLGDHMARKELTDDDYQEEVTPSDRSLVDFMRDMQLEETVPGSGCYVREVNFDRLDQN